MADISIKQLNAKHITVIGDVMLDVFSRGSISRMSPEAPVPVLDINRIEDRPGGALNVCNNLVSLGLSTEIIGVVGDDFEAFRLEYLCEKHKIKRSGLLRDSRRVTTSKTRFFDKAKPFMRADHESREGIPDWLEEKLLKEVRRSLRNSDACIIQDYNKGVLTPRMISGILDMADTYRVPVFVDPKKDYIELYAGAFLIKPNRHEAEQIIGYTIKTPAEARKASADLFETLQCAHVVLTLGGDGLILRDRDTYLHVPAHKLDVADITGAGDTVIAVLAALYSTGLPLADCAEYANRAAAKTCALPGVVPVRPEMLL
ncbi:MAG: bifunctional hydroxymethylpyrimidine kinase/phosphomethylpyrimidine kinase [Candidatus Marinimicrobia bacterium]|nr:bifunctional hydroxymethylpyrimidine kinase/phosphomethylpyrimidine kinase [Candidatus Neomarinimicrobiota bacterium]